MSHLEKIDVEVLLLLEGGDITWRVMNDGKDHTFKYEDGKYYFRSNNNRNWDILSALGINSLDEFLRIYIGEHNFDSLYLIIEGNNDET